jgi:hypothetical protein
MIENTFATRKQKAPRASKRDLVLKCFGGDGGSQYFGDAVFRLGIANPDRRILEIDLGLPHG